MFYLVTSICLLLLGLVLNIPQEAAVINCLWAAWVILAHLPNKTPKSKLTLTSKPRPTYTGRALS